MSRPPRSSVARIDDIDRRIIDHLQQGFPLSDTPYADVAAELGMETASLIERLRQLLDQGVLTRFGPLFQIERMGGAFCLAAMAVPAVDFERVAAIVNAMPEVAHNYERAHALNMWFVLATETPSGIAEAAARIEAACGLPVHCFAKEKEYFVDMRLPL